MLITLRSLSKRLNFNRFCPTALFKSNNQSSKTKTKKDPINLESFFQCSKWAVLCSTVKFKEASHLSRADADLSG